MKGWDHASSLWLAGLLLILSTTAALAGQANIFVYHRFGDVRYPSTNISAEVFAQQLELLRRERVPVLSFGEVARRLSDGTPLPEHCAVLTVDDAYRSFLDTAMPLMRRYQFPVTVFVNTDSVGEKDYLSWDELRALQREGVEFGSHSASHGSLLTRRHGESSEAWLARIRDDVRRGQQALTTALGEGPKIFAYPYGETVPETTEIIRQLGFLAAAMQFSGVVSEGSERFELPRFPMGGNNATLEGFRDKLHMHPLPVTVVSPESRLVTGMNPPELVIDLPATAGIDLERLAAFFDGKPTPLISDADRKGRYRIRAETPMTSRRGKYTVTAPRDGGGWCWFTYLWIRPESRSQR